MSLLSGPAVRSTPQNLLRLLIQKLAGIEYCATIHCIPLFYQPIYSVIDRERSNSLLIQGGLTPLFGLSARQQSKHCYDGDAADHKGCEDQLGSKLGIATVGFGKYNGQQSRRHRSFQY